jgi:hypothetical protein
MAVSARGRTNHRQPRLVPPDSDKIGAWSGNKADEVMRFRRDGDVGYYDGEL